MARKTKKKSKTQRSEDKPLEAADEASPKETERLALVAAQATDSVLSKSWDEFADDIESTSRGVAAAMAHGMNGALALGAKVVMFAERPEIKAEIALANHDKKGMPWKAHNWVAEQLTSTYNGLPSAKHLGDCARGYMKAKEKGLIGKDKGSLRKLLGWSPSAVPALPKNVQIEELNPAGLIPKEPKEPKDPADPADPKETDPRANLVTAIHDCDQSIQFYLDQCREADKDTSIKAVQEVLTALMATLETV